MKTTAKRNRIITVLRHACPLIVFIFSGCMLWTPQWQQPDSWMPPSDVSWLVERAEAKNDAIADRSTLIDAIEAYETVLTNDPAHFNTLTTLAELYVLLGDAYCESEADKEAYYTRAMRYSEQAMYTRPAFKQRVDQGEPTWRACRTLGKDEMTAMSIWNLAVLLVYRDCLGPVGRLINYRWMQRVNQVLERMTRIDSAWGDGFLDVQWGLYYLSAPKVVGGDDAQSAAYFNRAVARAPHQDLNRWFRARYRHLSAGDKQAFIADMQTVAVRPAAKDPQTGPWLGYCRRNAAESLANISDYF